MVKCEESSHCELECEHRDKHELIIKGRYGNHTCNKVLRLCDYLKQAVLCVEV